MRHAQSRRVGKEASSVDKELVVTICPCCGYEVERLDLNFFGSVDQLSFLGAGFPLFYNYVKYCIMILFLQILIASGYDLWTNIYGNYCYYLTPGGRADSLNGTNCP